MGRLDGKWVHKTVPENVLLSAVVPREGDPEWVDADMVVDPNHPFFFEHPLDHIPAMMLVEAGRQLGIAVSHMFLDVPFGTMFATDAFDIRFTDFAEVHLPVRIAARTSEKRFRRNRLAKMRMDGHFFQRGRQFGSMAGEWSMLVPELWARVRRMQQRNLR